MSPRGQIVLVTGASAGIGEATATLLAQRGHRVFGTSRTPVAGAGPAGVEILPLDVRSDASVAACVAEVLDRAGRVDALVNNAGASLLGESEGTSLDQVRDHFETNLFGAVRMTNAVLPAMRRQGGGRIVNVSSLAGLMGVPLLSLYCASKYALEGYSESLRYEVGQFGISVTLVEPGFARTDLFGATQVAAAPLADYDRVREAARTAIRARMEAGVAPARVAEVILRAIRERRPRLRHRVGSDATWLPRVKAMMPAGRFEAAVRGRFGLDGGPGASG